MKIDIIFDPVVSRNLNIEDKYMGQFIIDEEDPWSVSPYRSVSKKMGLLLTFRFSIWIEIGEFSNSVFKGADLALGFKMYS